MKSIRTLFVAAALAGVSALSFAGTDATVEQATTATPHELQFAPSAKRRNDRYSPAVCGWRYKGRPVWTC